MMKKAWDKKSQIAFAHVLNKTGILQLVPVPEQELLLRRCVDLFQAGIDEGQAIANEARAREFYVFGTVTDGE